MSVDLSFNSYIIAINIKVIHVAYLVQVNMGAAVYWLCCQVRVQMGRGSMAHFRYYGASVFPYKFGCNIKICEGLYM